MKVYFDLETNGLHFAFTKIHCISLAVDDGPPQLFINRRDSGLAVKYEGFLEDAAVILRQADEIIGHNIIDFDMLCLERLLGFSTDPLKIYDTLLASRIIYGDSLNPQGHGLKAWGLRLGCSKGDFGAETDWQEMTPAMGLYCNQDVEVTKALYKELQKKHTLHLPPKVWDMERKVALIIRNQKMHGVSFDEPRALKLYAELSREYNLFADKLRTLFPAICKLKGGYKTSRFVPKQDNKRLGYKKGVECFKIEVLEFNPNSPIHIEIALKRKYAWKPTKFTKTGMASTDEAVLSALIYPEAKELAKMSLIKHRLGMLHDGKGSFLKSVQEDGRIHGDVNSNGCVTGRMSHSKPNMNVPKTQVGPDGVLWGRAGIWGADFRALFTASDGRKIVGCDASGLELRMLAHYMSRFDGGAYAKVILEGDIHTVNQKAAGLPTRDQAKTFIYALLYGAGDAKIGSIVGKGAYAGKQLKKQFFSNLPALGALSAGVSEKARKQKHLRGLDGRILRVRHQHAALNTLLQGAGACVMKQALVNLWESADTSRFDFVLNVHDEYQMEADLGYPKELAGLAEEAIRKAGVDLGLRCPLDAEAKIGNNWQETH